MKVEIKESFPKEVTFKLRLKVIEISLIKEDRDKGKERVFQAERTT